MEKKLNISAIIITKNAQRHIMRCLRSLLWADEIVVIDNGSVDNTIKIASGMGAKVIKDNSADFSQLRNRGKGVSHNGWLLYVDSDEYLPSDLIDEIISVINSYKPNETAQNYFLLRENFYLGERWPATESMLRLFRRESLVGWYGSLHETARVTGSTGKLFHAIKHTTHENLESMLNKTNVWSETESRLRIAAGHPPVVSWRLLRVMSTVFFDYYLVQGGWKVGMVGIIESIYQGFSMFVTYAK
jgi:glycosyltransferase involved in cell wall biosynthesis